MELWTVGNKTILLFFVIAVSYFEAAVPNQWLLLFFLLYLALNLITHIAADRRIKQALILLILLYLIVCAAWMHPYFALLLPLNAYELASFHIRRHHILVLLPVLLPMLFIPGSMLILYALIAVMSFYNYVMIRKYMGIVISQEDQLEQLRKDRHRLARKLTENQDFIRASEYMVKLEERNRLSQEIHDGIGHAMTGALIQMEAAKRLLAHDPSKAEVLLQNAIGISKEGIEEIRLTLKNAKPPAEQLGLNRLKTAVELFGAQAGLLTTVLHSGDVQIINPLQWKIIHENVTEALTNSAKYAGATAVHVEIIVLNRFIKAVVSDNGQGAAKVVKGLGLMGMEERTAAVNGTVIADGAKGFIVTTLIPYGAE
jgi:signal transduction histidine kinase